MSSEPQGFQDFPTLSQIFWGVLVGLVGALGYMGRAIFELIRRKNGPDSVRHLSEPQARSLVADTIHAAGEQHRRTQDLLGELLTLQHQENVTLRGLELLLSQLVETQKALHERMELSSERMRDLLRETREKLSEERREFIENVLKRTHRGDDS